VFRRGSGAAVRGATGAGVVVAAAAVVGDGGGRGLGGIRGVRRSRVRGGSGGCGVGELCGAGGVAAGAYRWSAVRRRWDAVGDERGSGRRVLVGGGVAGPVGAAGDRAAAAGSGTAAGGGAGRVPAGSVGGWPGAWGVGWCCRVGVIVGGGVAVDGVGGGW